MARVAADDEGRPLAFGVRLSGVNKNGRPSEPKRIHVNAQTTVQMIFLDASYVLRETLGCDLEQLQNDFDLYLLRPGSHDFVLNPSRAIADYGVGKNDELQFRRKEKPINICVDLYPGEDRKITVNSGFPLTDVVAAICKEVGIENHAELSLALPGKNNKDMQLQWLDNASSLDGNRVNEGELLLLRKKFFILNDDITEAVQGNKELKELLYHQILQAYLTENYVGGGVNDNFNCSLISALLHQIEQGGENISDDAAVCKVMPKNRQQDMGFYTQIVTTYYQQRVGTMDKVEAQTKLLQTLSQPQSIIVNYYPVKKASDVEVELVLAIDSDQAFLCQEKEEGKLKLVEPKPWKLRDILDTNSTSQKDNLLRVNILGSWHELITSQRSSLSNYLREARTLVKQRVARGRMSTYFPSPPESTTPPIVQEEEEIEEGEKPTETQEEAESKQPVEEEEPLELACVEPVTMMELDSVESTPTEPVYEWPSKSHKEEDPIADGEGVKIEDNTPSLSSEDKSRIKNNLVIPLPHDQKSVVAGNSPTRSVKSTSSYSYKPGFLGKDYREVLDKFHHFQVVVLNQEVRPVLLEVQKSVREAVNTICNTFCIPNSSEYCLNIPKTEKRRMTGQKSTLSRTSSFRRKKNKQKASQFNPTLADDKPLVEQYNFCVKPHLIYLSKRSDSEETDSAENEMDCGMEWPIHENRDVARYRNFYQSWTGIIQGAYPVEKRAAIKLAALLTQIYYGDREANKVWPPLDYDCKVFLPDEYCDTLGISTEVEREHRRLVGKSTQECINDVIDGCTRLLTYHGVFFDISIPKKSEIMGVIPWNKMERYVFGVNHHGIFKINKQTGKTIFTRRFSDLYQWTRTEARFQLNFREWAEEFDAYSNQSNEILDTLQVFINLTGKRRADVIPSPLDGLSVQSLGRSGSVRSYTPRRSPAISDFNDLQQSSKRSSTCSPTTYDL